MRFALFTGSYNKNYSGGVLRAGAKSFASEVNVDSDGTFTEQAHIVDTIDALRIIGFSYSNREHYKAGDSCYPLLTDPVALPGEGNCRSWGNPIGEIYLESLRYLGGHSANPDFVPSDSVLGLRIESWEDPLSQQTYCSPLNVLAFNTSVNTYDDNQMGGLADLGAKKDARKLTNELGDHEDISGRRWFVGNTAADDGNICSAKKIGGLGVTPH